MNRDELISELASRIAAVSRPHPVRVAIDGVDAAGKTVLADELAPALAATGRQIVRASIDGFHHPVSIRRRRGASSPEGYYRDSFDHAALIGVLLGPLGPGGSLAFRRAVFDYRTERAVDSPLERADPDAILVLDGVFLLRPELRHQFELSIFVRADFAVTVARAERRDRDQFGSVDEVRRRYQERYVPGQKLYLAEADPERVATLVVDNDDPDQPFLVARDTEPFHIERGTPADIVGAIDVARQLSPWFTARALAQIPVDLRFQPFLIARAGSHITGFLSFFVTEAIGWISWLGVIPDRHRAGVGRALVDRVVAELAPPGVTALRTETLGDSVDYEPYARTRAFYARLGFIEHARVQQDDPEWPDRLTLTRPL